MGQLINFFLCGDNGGLRAFENQKENHSIAGF